MNFVVVDLDTKRAPAQKELVKKFYRGAIPHVTVLDSTGQVVYNTAGEVEESTISATFDSALKSAP